MNKKTIATILVILALGLVGYWAVEGANIWTKTERQVPVEDDLFGTTTMEWQKDFQPGLEYVGPLAFVLLVGATWLIVRARKEGIPGRA